MKIDILFFVGQLTTGGAERQIAALAKGLAKKGHRVLVATIFPGGAYVESIMSIPGVEWRPLWPEKGHSVFTRFWQLTLTPFRLRSILSHHEVGQVYSMLYLTNLLAWFATRGHFSKRLIWGIRASNMTLDWKRAIPERLCAWVSPSVPLMIANSWAGLEHHLEHGYRPKHYAVVANGINTKWFKRDEAAGRRLRQEINVGPDRRLVGMIARLDPVKDHTTFLRAAAILANKHEDVMFLCVGGGKEGYAKELQALAKKLSLSERLIWLGDRNDVVAIYSALNVLVSCSSSEGFSNVIGEAMACGVPCVVTDVGDSAMIVGNSTLITEPRNPKNLSAAICEVIENKGNINWREISRDRIINNFSIRQLINLTEHKLDEMHVVNKE